MELKQYLSIIYKKLWIVILFSIVTAGIAAYISFYILKPVYEANTSLYVTNKNVNSDSMIAYNDIMTGQQLVKDYRELIKSRTVTKSVIDELGLKGLTPGGLSGMITVNSKNDTRILEIKVQYSDPGMARDIANSLSKVFISKVVEIMKVDNVGVVDEAVASSSPVKPRPLTNIAIAFLIGIMASVGVIFLLDYLDDTIKTAEDVGKYTGLTVLGTIPTLGME